MSSDNIFIAGDRVTLVSSVAIYVHLDLSASTARFIFTLLKRS